MVGFTRVGGLRWDGFPGGREGKGKETSQTRKKEQLQPPWHIEGFQKSGKAQVRRAKKRGGTDLRQGPLRGRGGMSVPVGTGRVVSQRTNPKSAFKTSLHKPNQGGWTC